MTPTQKDALEALNRLMDTANSSPICNKASCEEDYETIRAAQQRPQPERISIEQRNYIINARNTLSTIVANMDQWSEKTLKDYFWHWAHNNWLRVDAVLFAASRAEIITDDKEGE